MRTLEQIRPDIDAIDEQIRTLFLQRMALAGEVAQNKMETGGKIFQPIRENQMVERLSRGVPVDYHYPYGALVRSITRYSRELQYQMVQQQEGEGFCLHVKAPKPVQRVCYQGAPGAYQQIAAQRLYPNTTPIALASWTDVFTEVSEGLYDVGVVPIDNSSVGTVDAVYDLLAQHDLYIRDSYILPIHHCLAACQGATLKSVTTAISHPHALRQCGQYLADHGYAAQQAVNTAIAAEMVRDTGDVSLAAICSIHAAQACGLQVLAPCINDSNCNETRFVAIARQLTVTPQDDCFEMVLTLENESGALNNVLSIIADYGVNMTRIHSRPNPAQPWTYIFYVDIAANVADPRIQPMLFHIREEIVSLRLIGSYHLQTQPTTPKED